jgi:hypothetical protein
MTFKSKFPIWVNIGVKGVGICYSHLVYFCGHLLYFMVIRYIFPPFWSVVPRKIWQHCFRVHVRQVEWQALRHAGLRLRVQEAERGRLDDTAADFSAIWVTLLKSSRPISGAKPVFVPLLGSMLHARTFVGDFIVYGQKCCHCLKTNVMIKMINKNHRYDPWSQSYFGPLPTIRQSRVAAPAL